MDSRVDVIGGARNAAESGGVAVSVHEQLATLLWEDFQFQLEDNPEFASQSGFSEHDARLQDLSPHSFDARAEHNRVFLQRLQALDLSDASVTDADRLHARLWTAAASEETEAIEVGCHLMPVNGVGVGPVYENFLETMEWMRFETEEDFQTYLARLMAFPAQVQSYTDLLAYGAMRGVTASESMMRRVPGRLRELSEQDVPKLTDPIARCQASPELAEQLHQAVEHCWRAPLRKLLAFFLEFYPENVRAEPGCCAESLKDGRRMYEQCLRFHTTTTYSPAEIHKIGLREVARIEERFRTEVLGVVGFEGSFVEFSESMKKDPRFFWTSEADILGGYRAILAEIHEFLPRLFPRLPSTPLEVVTKTSGAAAFYLAGTPNGMRPGRFYVNVSRLEQRAKYEMTSLALHEGNPGHHFQMSLSLENEEIPHFLRYIEDRRYEFCPARRPLYAAFLEGWALYCEHLGEEMGLYKTPQDVFGRLSMEMMRAVRLVADTGIHDQGWSVERAAVYMEEKTGMSTAECQEECHRYAAWPGQACGYKMGEIAIKEIRARAEAALGARFDLRAFHGFLLGSGPMPLEVLASRADVWIQEHGGELPRF